MGKWDNSDFNDKNRKNDDRLINDLIEVDRKVDEVIDNKKDIKKLRKSMLLDFMFMCLIVERWT